MRWRSLILPGLLLAALLAVPALGVPSYLLSRAVEVYLFAVLALSYDLLIGITGIVSFGHAVFFGAGAYTLALLMQRLGVSLWLALPAVIAFSGLLAAVLGALSLRVKGHFFAMITLAFAEIGHVVVQKTSEITGGADGLSIKVPEWFISNAAGRPDRTNSYFVALVFMVLAYLLVRRMTESPPGRVWQAIRENEFRAGALGYDTTRYKMAAIVVSGMVAALAGAGYALLVQQGATPEWLTTDITVQVLLMTIIGGVGTLHGPMLGAAVVRLLAYWLAGLRSISPVFDRWPLLFGLIYIAIVMFLPEGIVGTYRLRLARLFTARRTAA